YMLEPPSAEFWLGTDSLGRDVLSRIIYGARISMIVGFCATSLSIIISVVIGITCGFFGSKYDMVMQRLVDAWMVFPGLIILLVAISITGPGLWEIIFVLGLVYGIAGSRIIRGATLSTRENTYVYASNAIGASSLRQLQDAPCFGLEPGAKMYKCDLCEGLLDRGRKPVCEEACPMYALEIAPLDELRKKYGNVAEAEGFRYIKRFGPAVVFKSVNYAE
ncbi:MAG: ABC transporter permease subunit, partial [bacterium]